MIARGSFHDMNLPSKIDSIVFRKTINPSIKPLCLYAFFLCAFFFAVHKKKRQIGVRDRGCYQNNARLTKRLKRKTMFVYQFKISDRVRKKKEKKKKKEIDLCILFGAGMHRLFW